MSKNAGLYSPMALKTESIIQTFLSMNNTCLSMILILHKLCYNWEHHPGTLKKYCTCVLRSRRKNIKSHILCLTVNFLNIRKPKKCLNHPKCWTRWLVLRVMHPKNAQGIANSVDPDQTAPSLIWVCTVCPDLSVQKLRKITVYRCGSLP